MATLAKNKKRTREAQLDLLIDDIPAVAADIIYEGALVGYSAGYGRPLVAGDAYLGLAIAKCDNAAGAAGDKTIRVYKKVAIVVDVTGVDGTDDINKTVYASDDDTFTLTSTGNSAVGKIQRWISSTKCVVLLEAAQHRSI